MFCFVTEISFSEHLFSLQEEKQNALETRLMINTKTCLCFLWANESNKNQHTFSQLQPVYARLTYIRPSMIFSEDLWCRKPFVVLMRSYPRSTLSSTLSNKDKKSRKRGNVTEKHFTHDKQEDESGWLGYTVLRLITSFLLIALYILFRHKSKRLCISIKYKTISLVFPCRNQ